MGTASGDVTIAVTMPFYGSMVTVNFASTLAYISLGGIAVILCVLGSYIIHS